MEQAIERRDLRSYVARAFTAFPPASARDERIVRELRLSRCKPRTLDEL